MPVDALPLAAEHVRGARLFADRHHMIAGIGPERIPQIAELGVAFGTFSQVLIERFRPAEFHAIDQFRLHEQEFLWGHKASETFGDMSHKAWYEANVAHPPTTIHVREGDSFDVLATYPDGHFGLIYIDASHHYEDVRRDGDVAARKLTRDGILIFNDYIIWTDANEAFGVVPVVNELLRDGGWTVSAFALHPQMYCDITLIRS